MTIWHFFLSPKGRIARQEFWLGLIVILGVTIAGQLQLDPALAQRPTEPIKPPGLGSTLLNLVLVWPSAMISIKRFNDRDRPSWVGVSLGIAMVGMTIANYFGLLLDPETMGSEEKTVFFALLMFVVWAMVDNGLLRGTIGPNRYGPDPLEHQGNLP